MALTDGDRSWLTGEFHRLHDRLNNISKEQDSKVHKLDKRVSNLETGANTECAAAIAKHERKSVVHNPLLAIPLVGTLITAIEGIKKFFHL